MHPSSRRVGPTSARNSASSRDSCPSRAFSSTISVTASFDSLPGFEEPGLREFVLRLRPGFLPARLAIVGGIVLQPRKNATKEHGGGLVRRVRFRCNQGATKPSDLSVGALAIYAKRRPRHLQQRTRHYFSSTF